MLNINKSKGTQVLQFFFLVSMNSTYCVGELIEISPCVYSIRNRMMCVGNSGFS